MRRLNDTGAIPVLNPMCREWADLLWANNPAGIGEPEDALNPWCYGFWFEIHYRNPCEDYRFIAYQRNPLRYA